MSRRTLHALTAPLLLAVIAAGAAPAAGPQPHLAGTITLRDAVSYPAEGLQKDVTVSWAAGGRMIRDGAFAHIVRAAPRVEAYSKLWAFSRADGTRICWRTSFLGRAPTSETEWLQVTDHAQDRLSRRARLHVRVRPWQYVARMLVEDCANGGAPGEIAMPLVAADGGTMTRESVIGTGSFRNREPAAYLSPPPIVMRRQIDGRWRSKGAVIRRSGARTVRVAWDLTSTQPSDRCVPPSRARVRGKTPRQVRALLRRAGFRPGRALADSQSRGVARGRVSDLLTTPGNAERCGTAVWFRVRS